VCPDDDSGERYVNPKPSNKGDASPGARRSIATGR
jgi:hypothetical protein